MSWSNYQIRERWPECYSKGLLEMRECQPVPAKPEKVHAPGKPQIGRPRHYTDPDVKKADKGDDHTYVQKITGATIHD